MDLYIIYYFGSAYLSLLYDFNVSVSLTQLIETMHKYMLGLGFKPQTPQKKTYMILIMLFLFAVVS